MRLASWSGKEDDGAGISLKVSQNDLAAMVSVSRQTINRELARLTRQGVISVEYGRLTILDPASLRALAEGKSASTRHR
jgi:CRP/FNR family transcriptional regulator, cyclic AMP receptor protein